MPAYKLPAIDHTAELREKVEARKVPFLVHFTYVKNLPSILAHGLQTRSYLENNSDKYNCYINDGLRLDRRTNSVSLSVSHPNERMFYKYRMGLNNGNWVVLLLSPSLLWQKDCAFFMTNAANSFMSNSNLNNMRGANAFERLFYDHQCRNLNNLQPHDPTDVQAEVLVFDKIEPKHIQLVLFENPLTQQKNSQLLAQHNKQHFTNNLLFQQRNLIRSNGYLFND